jgi:hypothetical protein
MRRAFLSCLSMFFVLSAIAAVAQSMNRCSTEKVNHTDCTFTLDRRYPVTFPTFQMDNGRKITVIVRNPLAFETLSLDETGATLLPGTDQGAALLTSAIPDLAGLSFLSSAAPAETSAVAPAETSVLSPKVEGLPSETVVSDLTDPLINSELQDLRKTLDAANKAVADSLGTKNADSDGTNTDNAASDSTKVVKLALVDEVTAIYWQLNQILSPVPRPLTSPDAAPPANAGRPKPPQDALQPVSCPITPPSHSLPKAAAGTPSPWDCYPDWRTWMVCELASECSAFDPAGTSNSTTGPKFRNVLGEVGRLQGSLASGATPPPNPIFDQKGFDQAAGYAHSDIEALPCTKDQDGPNVDKTVAEKHAQECKTKNAYEATLNTILLDENHLVTKLSALSGVLASVQKDFLTYYANINLTGGTLLATSAGAVTEPDGNVGLIFDPWDGTKGAAYPRFLGRNVTWSVNAVNQIGTSRTSVTTTASKTSIATITVIYASPHFEASAGAIFSFVHNRTFANVTQSSGAIDVQETGARPEVIPFVAGNYRLHDFEVPFDHRRGAFYATAYVGLNPYTTLPEFGGGPTFSWRSFMLSAFYERAHDTHLISGEMLGPICGTSATTMPPACSTTPAAPTTSPFWVNGFGIGISIRVPTTFAPGTGGISQ